jgi:predicted helicase
MIADEAHNTTSSGLTPFTRPLYDDHIPAKRRLFLTATPRIVSRRVKSQAGEDSFVVHAMDDTDLYGEVAHTLPFSEAIERDLLTDYEVFVVGVDDPEIARAIRERELLRVGDTDIDGETLAAHIALHRAMKARGSRRIITFHRTVKQAEAFARTVPVVSDWLKANNRPGVHDVWGEAVSGDMPVARREKVLARFEHMDESAHGVVSNARCLGEGVDVPTIDSLAFVQPKRSEIDIVQAVGRAIRKSDSKKGKATIILPVPILDPDDPAETVASSAFETVWRVLEALRDHDDVMAETLDALRTQLGERGGGSVRLPKLTLDLPRSVSGGFGDALQLRLLERSTVSFWAGLGHLKAYEAEHGDCLVPQSFATEDGFKLGSWCDSRRNEHRKGKLESDRVEALEALGFVWEFR